MTSQKSVIHIPSALKARSAQRASTSFFHQEIETRLLERLLDHKKDFNAVLFLRNKPDVESNENPDSGSDANIDTRTNAPAAHLQHPKIAAASCVDYIEPSTHLSALSQKERSFDLILGNLSLNISQDPKVDFLKIGKSLVGDGVLSASFIGSESFKELHIATSKANSLYAHVSPLPSMESLGGLLQSLKYALPVIDREEVTLHYASFESLMTELKSLGSINFHPQKNNALTGKSFWRTVAENYPTQIIHGQKVYPLTLEVIYVHALRPHQSQQQPLSPSRAYIPLTDILK